MSANGHKWCDESVFIKLSHSLFHCLKPSSARSRCWRRSVDDYFIFKAASPSFHCAPAVLVWLWSVAVKASVATAESESGSLRSSLWQKFPDQWAKKNQGVNKNVQHWLPECPWARHIKLPRMSCMKVEDCSVLKRTLLVEIGCACSVNIVWVNKCSSNLLFDGKPFVLQTQFLNKHMNTVMEV